MSDQAAPRDDGYARMLLRAQANARCRQYRLGFSIWRVLGWLLIATQLFIATRDVRTSVAGENESRYWLIAGITGWAALYLLLWAVLSVLLHWLPPRVLATMRAARYTPLWKSEFISGVPGSWLHYRCFYYSDASPRKGLPHELRNALREYYYACYLARRAPFPAWLLHGELLLVAALLPASLGFFARDLWGLVPTGAQGFFYPHQLIALQLALFIAALVTVLEAAREYAFFRALADQH